MKNRFLHHDLNEDGSEGAVNLEACSAAVARLNGGRGGAGLTEAERQSLYEHLAAHLKDGGKEAPQLVSPIEARRAFAKAAVSRLGEAGRVLSSANEQKLRDAVEGINQVLSQLDSEDTADDAAATEAKRNLLEAWSDAAWDASGGAWLLGSLIEIMGDESEEPEQFALLRTAFDAISQWISLEVAEIATPEDEEEPVVIFDYESNRIQGVREAVVGDIVPIREGAVRSDGTVRMKVIQPGWGSSGYYSAEVLERDGPKAFPAGTKNFWDHPTLTEEVERPERSLRDLAGELVTDAVYEADGPEGPGLYADARVVSEFGPAVNELAPFIGVSIRALGTAHQGSAEGRNGPIIDKLIAGESIDYVTTPGAGGQVLQLFEAARRQPAPTPKEEPMETGTKDLEARLAEATEGRKADQQKISRMQERLLLRDAGDLVAIKLAEHADIPAVTRRRLAESLTKAAPANEAGELDKEAFEKQIEEAVKDEVAYLADVTGSGRVTGFGGGTPDLDITGELSETFKHLGLSEAEAKTAAAGRQRR